MTRLLTNSAHRHVVLATEDATGVIPFNRTRAALEPDSKRRTSSRARSAVRMLNALEIAPTDWGRANTAVGIVAAPDGTQYLCALHINPPPTTHEA